LSERTGFLIAFEGTEGAGKSTQLVLASQALERAGHRVRLTLEPGGTPLGKEIRQLLLHREDTVPTPLAELFLYLADRSQHLAEVIRPHLHNGDVVLTDRFSGSTIAYQGYGRGLDLSTVVQLDAAARQGVAPDLTVLLDCPVRVGLRRARESDRFHAELEAFHERVREGFLALARSGGWTVIDATNETEVVHDEIMRAILIGLEKRSGT
jgi:dTMP kinase